MQGPNHTLEGLCEYAQYIILYSQPHAHTHGMHTHMHAHIHVHTCTYRKKSSNTEDIILWLSIEHSADTVGPQ